MPRPSSRWIALAMLLLAGPAFAEEPPALQWLQHDIKRPKPPVVEPADAPIASKPPKDAIVLFDGKSLDAWKSQTGGPAGWKVVDGTLQTVPGAGMIVTKRQFGDVQLHIEWAAPNPPHGEGQDRGNSGIFLMGLFEIQVLDSYRAETYADGQAGAIYGQFPPLANASRPPGEWQSYDIAFRRPRLDESTRRLEPARITVFHNGILVQDNEEPVGRTSWLEWESFDVRANPRGPVALQDHDHPVRYRNIWLREIAPRPTPTAAEIARPPIVTLDQASLVRLAGRYRHSPRPGTPPIVIVREDDHLIMKLPSRPRPLKLVPTSATTFIMPYTDAHFTFRIDEHGHVTGVDAVIADGRREWPRIAP